MTRPSRGMGAMLPSKMKSATKVVRKDAPGTVDMYKKGGKVKCMKKGGSVSSASKRADGIASKGKTKGKFC